MPQTHDTISPVQFTGALRLVPAAVTIVTTRYQQIRSGMTATAVAPVSAQPAQILVAINNAARCGQSIAQSRIFAVNFLSQQDEGLARLFSQGGLAQEEKFDYGEWNTDLTGAPVLMNSLAAFDCSLTQSHQCGTHCIFIGSVLSVTSQHAPALLYRDGAYSRSAGTN